jgi:transcriptional regulator with XRE-family HTH domain
VASYRELLWKLLSSGEKLSCLTEVVLMSTDSDRQEIYEKFKESKEYRDAFIAEHIYSRLPLKIRGLREQRGWSQKELGEKVGMAQAWVSKLEDPSYGKYTIATLLRLASAFDVGLDIDFTVFSEILDKALTLTPESFEVASFADDPGFVVYISTIEGSQPQHRIRDDFSGSRMIGRAARTGHIRAVDNTVKTSVILRPEEDKTTEEPLEFRAYAATAV